MYPLRHFIKQDKWSHSKYGELRKCAKCSREGLPSDQLFTTTEYTPLVRATPRMVSPSVHRLHRRKSVSIPTSTSAVELCSTCYRDLPSQKIIRGKRPEYTPRYLTNLETTKEFGLKLDSPRVREDD